MTTETKERAPAAMPNKARRQRVQIRKLQARVRELEAEVEQLSIGPYVCPGCHAVAAPCAPDCIDAAMRREREDVGLADAEDDQ